MRHPFIDYCVTNPHFTLIIFSLSTAVRPDTNDVCILLSDISYDWDKIAKHLKVPFGFREEFRKRVGIDDSERLAAVIDKWDNLECSDVTWETVIDALISAGQKKTARKVEEYLLNDTKAKKYNFTSGKIHVAWCI